MKNVLLLFSALLLFSCSSEKKQVALLVKNATIYKVNPSFETTEAFVVNQGKIVETGTISELEKKYKATEIFDAKGKTIVPGLIDAHAHLYELGISMQQVQLYGTKSFQEVLDRVVAFQKNKNTAFILGSGWDQNDWDVKEFPTKDALDSLFPNTPVALTRIDGHAMLVNSLGLKMAGITSKTKLKGGEIILQNGKPTGILIDNPMGLMWKIFPKKNKEFYTKALKEATYECLKNGLTTINEASIGRQRIELLDSLQQNSIIKLRVYAMVANRPQDLMYYFKKGIIKKDRLTIRSVKVMADGALGSRGATMRKEYSDQHGHFGAMITTEEKLLKVAKKIANAGYQMNTHAIGDSANISVLRVYSEVLKNIEDPRWKVEHAQIVTPTDFDYFSKKILPSIQPTHATSDMYWAEDRVGTERIKGAYAYKTLLEKSGMVALGTDFPVEKVNPMYTFYAAVARKDLKHYPKNGFRKEEVLSREETLKGMTIWAAYSNFEEHEKGSIESGKFADFTVLDTDIMTCPENDIPNTKVIATFINGEMVYKKG